MVLLLQKLQSGTKNLKARKSNLLSQHSTANGRIWKASVSAGASLNGKCEIKLEVAFFRDQMSVPVLTSTVAIESSLASACDELVVAKESIDRLRAEVTTGYKEIDNNWQRDCAQFSLAVDKRLWDESDHRHELLAWVKRVRDSESKLFVAVDVKTLTRERSTKLFVRLAGEESRSWCVTDSRAFVVAAMNSFGTGVDGLLLWMDRMMGKLLKGTRYSDQNGFSCRLWGAHYNLVLRLHRWIRRNSRCSWHRIPYNRRGCLRKRRNTYRSRFFYVRVR